MAVWESSTNVISEYDIFIRKFQTATTLTGTQYLYGTADNDVLDGGSGNDYMYGGTGNDTYYVQSAGDVVVENIGEGNDTIVTSTGYTLSSNLENLTLVGNSAASLYGNNGNNIIIGNDSFNTIYGNDGFDTIYAGDMDDQVYGGSAGDVIHGDGGNDTLFGDSGVDVIYGGEGQDYLGGGSGDGYMFDTLFGGSGDDTLAFSDGSNANIFTPNIAHGDDGNDLLIGASGFDKLYGDAGDDQIQLSLGGDFIYGGEGIDTLTMGGMTTGVWINLTTGTVKILNPIALDGTISGVENINGTLYPDVFHGDAGANVLDGGVGADKMYGRGGDDIYYVRDSLARVFETYAGVDTGGFDTVYADVTFTLPTYVEDLYLTGISAINGTGNSGVNALFGNSAANILSGGSGADLMHGYGGSDVYVVDNIDDIVSEADALGTDAGGDDRVNTSVSYTIGAFIERLSMTGTANIDGVGNSLANTIIGNSGNNKITGGGGNDSLRGEAGDDTYIFGPNFGRDTITEVSGNDTIQFGLGITAGMIIFEDVGADRYYAVSEVGKTASQCNHRIRIIGGAGGAVIENIVYSTDPAPASSATLIQAMVAQPQATGYVTITMPPNLRREAVTLTANLM